MPDVRIVHHHLLDLGTSLSSSSVHQVKVQGVTSAVLAKIIEYMDHHKGKEPPIIERPLKHREMRLVCEDVWDADFVDAFFTPRQFFIDVWLVSLVPRPVQFLGLIVACQL